MKKIMQSFWILILVLVLFTSSAWANTSAPMEKAAMNGACYSASAVAQTILDEAGIDYRYGRGQEGGFYLRDVARAASRNGKFPDYSWNGTWDGLTFIDKSDQAAYYEAVYKYLVFKGAGLPCYCDLIGTWVYGTDYRRVCIERQFFGQFEGKVTDPAGNVLGNLRGQISDKDSGLFYMEYDRIGYDTDGYFAIFHGAFTDENTITGTRIHGFNDVLSGGDGCPESFLFVR